MRNRIFLVERFTFVNLIFSIAQYIFLCSDEFRCIPDLNVSALDHVTSFFSSPLFQIPVISISRIALIYVCFCLMQSDICDLPSVVSFQRLPVVGSEPTPCPVFTFQVRFSIFHFYMTDVVFAM